MDPCGTWPWPCDVDVFHSARTSSADPCSAHGCCAAGTACTRSAPYPCGSAARSSSFYSAPSSSPCIPSSGGCFVLSETTWPSRSWSSSCTFANPSASLPSWHPHIAPFHAAAAAASVSPS
eukprot:6212993-Pleurochrysis_carterae.AAC.3